MNERDWEAQLALKAARIAVGTCELADKKDHDWMPIQVAMCKCCGLVRNPMRYEF